MTTKLIDTIPAFATHPGEIIADEIEAREMNQAEFAALIGMSPSQFNEILNGKRGINAELALILEQVLQVDASYWMEAQSNYELDKARLDDKVKSRMQTVKAWQEMKSNIAYDFLKKNKYIIGESEEDLKTVKKIYKVEEPNDFKSLYASSFQGRFRKTATANYDPVNVLGWTKLIEYLGSKEKVSAFHPKKEKELIAELKRIITANKNVKAKVKSTLAAAGIKLVYQKNASKCPVDGITLWSEGKHPLIGMSLRYDRLDNFAFTLFHELGHVFLHLVNQPNASFIDDLDSKEQKKLKEEKEANEYASNQLISKEDWEVFITSEKRMQDQFTIEYAKEINIHPIILKGRLKHELKDYTIRTRIDNELT